VIADLVGRVRRALPIRWKLAITSAALTFAILTLFAVVIGLFAGRQVRGGFDDDLRVAANDLQDKARVQPDGYGGFYVSGITRSRIEAAGAGDARIRIIDRRGRPATPGPDLGGPHKGIRDHGPYRVVTVPLNSPSFPSGPVGYLQYAKPRANPEHTTKDIRLFLTGGVLAGTLLALIAGLAIARRTMRPIAELTRAAKDITRTRDPGVRELPKPDADDEVADLARTLEEMLMALDASRSETEAALSRQREFVADASHELRTPLTSVLSNLELLQATLTGEDAEIAESALRSSRRMRRLVADLLLLARADAGRVATRQSVDLRAVVRDAAGEAMPLADNHNLTVSIPGGDAPHPVVHGAPDDLHRLVLNLIENALRHTPDGTSVRVSVEAADGQAVIRVADDGPGIPDELRARIFDRFVRGGGDSYGGARRGGSGLGLAIVKAVAESHHGTVELAAAGDQPGTCFVVRMPLVQSAPAPQEIMPPPREPAPTS
jgi:two-component system, OmpR family, sensor kinase